MAGRIGGNAPKSIGKRNNQASQNVAGDIKSAFSTGAGWATNRDNPMMANPMPAHNTSAGS